MEKKNEVNLDEIDAAFIISSFKNKERRSNPSSIPRPLYPPGEKKRKEKEAQLGKSDESGQTACDTSSTKPSKADSVDESDTVITTEESAVATDSTKRITSRQRKAAFEEYRNLFLTTPKIIHRKPVFISEELRERLDEIARRLGNKGMSASGFLENMAIQHLKTFEEDIEYWRKM